MKQAIGYIRVSTEGQAVDGVSLAAQEAKIRAWCELNDYRLIALHVDAGMSGGRADNRPALQQALEACTKSSALVVYSLSRLARSTRDTLDIADRLSGVNADLVSLSERIDTTTAAGKMVFRLLAVLAEFERDQISERTKAAMDHMRRQGQRVGSIPYGYRLSRDGVRLAPCPKEQEIITYAKQLRAASMSYRAIAKALSAAGHLSRGKGWHPQTVKNILGAA
jgi:site-specific DNA recombinase